MNTREMLPLLFFVCIAAEGIAPAHADGQIHEFVIPNHGKLILTVPAGLRGFSKPLSEPPSVILHFAPQSGDAFDIQVTSVWLDHTKVAKSTPESLKATVASTAEEQLGSAVEKKAELKELRGPQTTGFYFSLTDRAPAPGEYKYLSQGAFATGDVETVFTILYREPVCPERDAALQMFAQAKYVK